VLCSIWHGVFVLQEVIIMAAEQVDSGYSVESQVSVGSETTDDVAEKQETEYDVIADQVATGSRRPTTVDVAEIAEPLTDSVGDGTVSTDDNNTTSLCNDETGVTEVPDEMAQATSSDQKTEALDQMTGSSSVEPQELQDQSITPDRCQEGHSSTATESLDDFDVAAAVSEITSMPDQQPEAPMQPDTAISEPVTSSEPEVVNNSEYAHASPGGQQKSAMNEGISTLSAVKNSGEQSEMIDQVDSHLDVQFSLTGQSAQEDVPAVVQTSEQLPGSSADETSSKDQCLGVAEVEQSEQPHLDESSTSKSELPSNDAESTSPHNMPDSCREEMIASAAAREEVTYVHAEEDHLGDSATESTSLEQPGCNEEQSASPLSEQQLPSAVPIQRSETESQISTMPSANFEPVFTFPEPLRHHYESSAVADDSADDAFVEHSSTRNDMTASDEILPSSSAGMTSSATAAAAGGSVDISRQEQPLSDELCSADEAPASLQQSGEEERVIPSPLLTPGARGCEVQVQPTSEPAAAVSATASVSADDGVLPAEKLSDETRADDHDFSEAVPTVDELKTSSSQQGPSTAEQRTDVVDQQLDEVPQPESDQQPTSDSAERQHLSLVIPGHDSDLYASDNQVSVYIHSLQIVRAQISVLRKIFWLEISIQI